MQDVRVVPEMVAYCGLYCGACRSHLNGKCKGCHENSKATWCTVRACCIGKNIKSCAECADHANPSDCKKFNNFMSKLFGFVFRSDRAACIAQIRDLGIDGHAAIMAKNKAHTIKRQAKPKANTPQP